MASSTKAAAITGDPLMALTEKQRLFVDALARGENQTMAGRIAGFATPGSDACALVKQPKIQAALAAQYRKNEKVSTMTRKKVMDGFLEAIEMAKLQSEPAVMVGGWREIGRMCGYYAAETKKIDINITAKRAVDKLESLSDAELLELIDEDSETIEGEFTEVFEAT